MIYIGLLCLVIIVISIPLIGGLCMVAASADRQITEMIDTGEDWE
jgi:hypothetical protein